MKNIMIDGKPITINKIGRSITMVSLVLLIISVSSLLCMGFTEDPFVTAWIPLMLMIFVPLAILGRLLMIYYNKRHK